MTPPARVAAAIEILDTALTGVAVEKALTNWARGHRFAGSKDRAAIRDLVFDAIRQKLSRVGHSGVLSGRGLMLGGFAGELEAAEEMFSGQGYGPSSLSEAEREALKNPKPLSESERLDCPEWLLPQMESSLGAKKEMVLEALRHRASVYLRVNLARTTLDSVIKQLGKDEIVAHPHPLASTCLEVVQNARRLKSSQAYSDGLVELQDAASQALVEALPLSKGMKVLDYCAGGGGKSLAMAATGATVFAHDAAPARMRDLPARASRAQCNIHIRETGALAETGPFDLVLCDAPCSGSGAWRRAPQGKWDLTPEGLASLIETQREILSLAKGLVKPGGALAYATCSLLDCENIDQSEWFVSENSSWSLEWSHSFLPSDGGDGFFGAVFRKP